MNFKKYIKDLKAKVAAIEASPEFKSQSEFFDYIVHKNIDEMEDEIAREEGMEGFALSKPIKDFYRAADGFNFAWQYKGHADKSLVTTGMATISTLYEIYDPDAEMGQPHSQLYEKYRLFDWTGKEEQVYMKFTKGSNEPALFYFAKKKKRYYPLSIDFTTYMELLSEARGLTPWQRFFVADKSVRIDEKRAERFFADLRLLFPDAEPGRFRV